MQQSQSGTARQRRNVNKPAYKTDGKAAVLDLPSNCRTRFVIVAITGIMVSAWFIARTFVAFAPLTSVFAQYAAGSKFPSLLDATVEELTVGLEKGDFTSVDLVQVCVATFFGERYTEQEAHQTPGMSN